MNSSQDYSLQAPSLATIQKCPLDILSTLRHAHDFLIDDRSIRDIARDAQNTAIATLKNEKLELGKEGTKYLLSALKEEASSLQAGGGSSSSLTEEERAACCLTSNAVANRDFKPNISHLMTELTRYVNELCRQEDPILVLNETVPELIEREMAGGDEGLEFPEHFWELPGIVEHDFRTEKLYASKETASFLKNALGYLDEKEHRREIARLFEESASRTDCGRRELSPLYICAKTQNAYDSSGYQNDLETADLSQDAENILTEEKNTYKPHEPQEPTISKYFSFVTTSITDKAGKRPIDTGHQKTIKPDEVENEPSETVPEKTIPVLQHSTRSPTNQNSISDTPESRHQSPLDINTPNIPPTLGTLSSFMQTRGRENKRRKMQNKSSYFKSPPAPRLETEIKTNPEKTPPEQPDLQKLPTDDLTSYPQFPAREPTWPLLLILSTTLLHTNRAFINSVESLSSPVARLIFRDYTARNSTGPDSSIVEEADVILSPTTGIILTTSQQTTQTHLPGHGSPEFSSPIKERIARVAQRYERIYIFIQVLSSLDTKTMSSVRELGAFCISLSKICTIQTLLVQPDHTLDWVLAIATKHAMSNATIPREKGTQGEILWPSYLDELTQWELFLRRAGLNPFAAQSVLDILRNGSMSSGENTSDDRRTRELSRFIEMPREARRELFQNTVGQRVLHRVENAVEMDWQIEWAVDLS